MRGDIILFRTANNPFDMLIAWATKGSFVHVEIDEGDGHWIGALHKGIDRHGDAVGRPWARIPIAPYLSKVTGQDDLNAALKWAGSQVGSPYGWTDIFNEGIRWFGLPFNLSQDGHLDCSDFVTRYLLIARAAGPLGAQALHPESVSPNDIARAYNIH